MSDYKKQSREYLRRVQHDAGCGRSDIAIYVDQESCPVFRGADVEKMLSDFAFQQEKIQKLEFYQKLQKKIEKILNGELDIEDYHMEVAAKIEKLEE